MGGASRCIRPRSAEESRPGETAAPVVPETPREETRPVEETLSPQAAETYAYLLFIQALLDEDEAALLDVTPELAKTSAPLNVWVDGGVWLMGRKSPNAAVFLENALAIYPEDLSLNLLYSESLAQHGMTDKGVRRMRDYVDSHPKALDARLQLALLLVKDKKFEEAQELLNAIPAGETDPLIPYYQAKALVGMDKKPQAIPYLKRVIKAMPEFIEPLAELVQLYEEEGNYREARATCERLLKVLKNSSPEVSLNLINLSLKMKQPDKAAEYARKGPDTIPFKLRAANMLMESRHYLQAENILKQVAGRDDAPYEVYLMLADLVFEQRRNLKAALEWLDKTPADSKGIAKARLLGVQLMAEAGKYAQALEAADKGIAEYPDMPEFWDMKIRLMAREKKTEEALAVAREATKKWPDSTQLAFLLGSLLDERGLKKEAFEVMEGILLKQPENFQALNYVGFSLAEENRDLQRALKLLARADELSPNQAYIVDSLAWALFRAGRGEEALKEIRRAVGLGDTPDPAIWEHYGDIAVQQGEKEAAKKAYRNAIELKP
ncbi:MAG: tetratricopeptide repeat protein, partial [Desulfovibrio sp.]|nr:tetratricopeptide repeat protein [Desulfovibrio sp.]